MAAKYRIRKKPDWDTRLFNFIVKNKNRPFKWGEWDCCLFADAVIKEITGKSIIPRQLKWKDKRTAVQAIKKYGGSFQECMEKATSAKNIQSVPTAFITTGDLVMFKDLDNRILVGICDGYVTLAPSGDGLERKNNDLAIKVWRIQNV